MKLTDIDSTHRNLITEGWNDTRLTLLETQHIIPFVSSIERYIVEAQLTPDQISQLFTSVEQGATAAGSNRTMVGKGKDAASFINKKIDELGAQLKKAGPVKNADAKFNQLKDKIGATDSKVVKAIQGVSDWAKENPGKASIAVAVLTTAAAMSGGPMGGAVAGFVARATKDLLQGADLSTAVGKAAKTGIIGAFAGLGLEKIGDMLGDALVWGKDKIDPALMRVRWNLTTDSYNFFTARVSGTPEDIKPIKAIWDQATGALESKNYAEFEDTWAKLGTALDEMPNPWPFEVREARAAWDSNTQAFRKVMDGVAAGVQAAAQASDDKKESTQFNPIQIETIIEWCDQSPAVMLTEGPLDSIKKGAATAGGAIKKGATAVGAKAAKVGKNMTTKVTADKLNSAWKKAGSPTDSDAVANILRQQGVDDKVLAPVYKQLGAKLPSAPGETQPQDTGFGKTGTGEPIVDPSKVTVGRSKSGKFTKLAAAPVMDFKGIQQAVANLTSLDANALVTHIDSLGSKPAMDFKRIQQAVAKLTPLDAKALVTHIDTI
jgi:hypothetical protein